MKTAALVTADIYTGKPLTTTEAFVKPPLMLLQSFFAEQNMYVLDDADRSPMMIGGPFTYETKDWGTKDTIIVSRGPIKAHNHQGTMQHAGTSFPTGAKIFQDLAFGSTSTRIICKNNTEALAAQVFDLYWLLKQELASFGAFKISNLVASKESPVKDGGTTGLTMVEITFDTQMERRWSVTPTNRPLVKGVDFIPCHT